MRSLGTMLALLGFAATTTAIARPQVPICTFDPIKGEYICPPGPVIGSTTTADHSILVVPAKCAEEGLRKCTREHQGSVCKNGDWELVHRCATGQQCDMKDGNFCCRIRGPGFSC